ncbi:prolipoprotein diacylglyceryl transferase [Stomatohabitans albus]|uniref:prolipoprotein diacylglyceryl transferase n=1 Tax=Stomatohabitans albus TaxID=3110766 RepID=UPI00300CEC36
MTIAQLAQIPAPPISEFHLGPLTVHMYGLIIATGVIIAATWMRKRYVAAGGDGEFADNIAFWGILAGFLGGRIGYVIVRMTALNAQGEIVKGYYLEHPEKILAVWEGGLAIFGGLILGGLTVYYLIKRANKSPGLLFDALAPALPVAQAMGRWGNYFNQELYGGPTDLPWKLFIEPPFRRPGYEQFEYFHPTFLYESLGNIIISLTLLRLEKTGKVPRGGLIWCYGIGYGILRFCMELLRTDTSFRILGLSRNAWVAMITAAVSIAVLVWLQRRRSAQDERSTSDVTQPAHDENNVSDDREEPALSDHGESVSPGEPHAETSPASSPKGDDVHVGTTDQEAEQPPTPQDG